MNKVRAALYSGLVLLLGTFFAVWNELITVKTVVMVLLFMWETCIILAIGLGAIGVGWVTTYIFRTVFLEPDKKEGWKVHKKRLSACSFVWTTAANTVALSLRYIYEAPVREVIERLVYIGLWTLLVAGISIVAYDVIAKRLWVDYLRHITPKKWVQTPTGIEERDADEPSGDGEKTVAMTEEEKAALRAKYSKGSVNGSGH